MLCFHYSSTLNQKGHGLYLNREKICNNITHSEYSEYIICILIIIIIDGLCIALFSGVPKLTGLYNILQHFLSFTNIIHIIVTANNV